MSFPRLISIKNKTIKPQLFTAKVNIYYDTFFQCLFFLFNTYELCIFMSFFVRFQYRFGLWQCRVSIAFFFFFYVVNTENLSYLWPSPCAITSFWHGTWWPSCVPHSLQAFGSYCFIVNFCKINSFRSLSMQYLFFYAWLISFNIAHLQFMF